MNNIHTVENVTKILKTVAFASPPSGRSCHLSSGNLIIPNFGSWKNRRSTTNPYLSNKTRSFASHFFVLFSRKFRNGDGGVANKPLSSLRVKARHKRKETQMEEAEELKSSDGNASRLLASVTMSAVAPQGLLFWIITVATATTPRNISIGNKRINYTGWKLAGRRYDRVVHGLHGQDGSPVTPGRSLLDLSPGERDRDAPVDARKHHLISNLQHQ